MTPWLDDGDVQLYKGDAASVLADLPAESVQCVVTSPPYWGLRDYGTGAWDGGDADCDHLRPAAHGYDPFATSRLGPKRDGVSATNSAHSDDVKRQQYADACGRCGARRIDQQIGLESDIGQYVDRLVGVFREVRRVLRPDGVVWLNLGDAYAGGSSGERYTGMNERLGRASGARKQDEGQRRRSPATDLKPKDLCMIPARVAMALQEPYYTGRIKREVDRMWLAAMIDAEGCIFIHRRKAGQPTGRKATPRTADNFGPGLHVTGADPVIAQRCFEIVGGGTVDQRPYSHKRTAHTWRADRCLTRELLRELHPYLVSKQQQARIAINCPTAGDEGYAAWQALKTLHAGDTVTLDYPEPAPMFEPGWYLRSAVVWSKDNPMPESVTDRPTSSYEMVFMLTKSARYYYDQEAVRERYEAVPQRRHTSMHDQPKASAREAARVAQGNPQGGAHASPYDVQAETLGDLPPDGPRGPDGRRVTTRTTGPLSHENYGELSHQDGRERWPNGGRNMRNVWRIPTQPTPEAHFATFPTELVRRCIAAGTSEAGECSACGAPWTRQVEREGITVARGNEPHLHRQPGNMPDRDIPTHYKPRITTLGWAASCACGVPARPQTVLDPFVGSGTTALVARRLGRHAVGIDLNAEYLQIAADRTRQLSLLG